MRLLKTSKESIALWIESDTNKYPLLSKNSNFIKMYIFIQCLIHHQKRNRYQSSVPDLNRNGQRKLLVQRIRVKGSMIVLYTGMPGSARLNPAFGAKTTLQQRCII